MHVRLLDWGRCSNLQKAWCLVVTFGILLMFFSPLPHGSGTFQQTHGPTTALRAMRGAVITLLSMATAFGTAVDFAAITSTFAKAGFALRESAPSFFVGPVLLTCDFRC